MRRQYRRLALLCHPDKTEHKDANRAFQALSEAFECLHDPEKQAVYFRHHPQPGAARRSRILF